MIPTWYWVVLWTEAGVAAVVLVVSIVGFAILRANRRRRVEITDDGGLHITGYSARAALEIHRTWLATHAGEPESAMRHVEGGY